MDTYRNIKEDYKIQQTIGRGTFASVKRVKQRATGTIFACKVMSKRKLSQDDQAGIRTEIEILKQLDHPNIVRLLDVYEDERHWCLVMDLMTGGELFDFVAKKTEGFAESEVQKIIKIIVDVIKYCHNVGIVHRDLKLENLLLASEEEGISSVRVADFGLARIINEGSLASTACGTPGYVAPEILREEKYGKQCDVWSIGVICFILLSGEPPFYSDD